MPTCPQCQWRDMGLCQYRRKGMSRLGAVKVDAPRFQLIIRHCDERDSADHADWTDDALAEGAEHSGLGDVQQTTQFACAHECPLIAGDGKFDCHAHMPMSTSTASENKKSPAARCEPPGMNFEYRYLTCAETSLVISNMLTCFLPPKTALRAGSALIIVLFLGS